MRRMKAREEMRMGICSFMRIENMRIFKRNIGMRAF